jgi:hypothetical protein
MSKSKCQMVDALRAIVYAVRHAGPVLIANGSILHLIFLIWYLTFVTVFVLDGRVDFWVTLVFCNSP